MLNLEQLHLTIKRTRGDEQVTAIYHALSRLSHLRRLVLCLEYSVGPDQNDWVEKTDGIDPLTYRNCDVPIKMLREAFSNAAMDGKLARSIFDVVSLSNKLPYLSMQVRLKRYPNTPLWCRGDQLTSLLAWLAQPWLFMRDNEGKLSGIYTSNLKQYSQWGYLKEDTQRKKDIMRAFQNIWPPESLEW